MEPTPTLATTHSRRRRLAIGAAIIAPLAFAACGSSGSSDPEPAPKNDAPAPSAAPDSVDIKLIAYRPAKVSVTAGTTVTWNQMDAGFHTVTSGTVSSGAANVTTQPDDKFGSGEIAKGEKFSQAFADPGTYPYFCEIHPATMTGEVTVT